MLKVLLAAKEGRDNIRAMLKSQEIDLLPAGQPPQELVAKNSYHLILLEDGMDLLPAVKAADPRAEVILFGRDEGRALEAIKQGAAAYLKIPIQSALLEEAVRRIEERVQIRRETGELERQLIHKYTFAGITARNPQMLDIVSFIGRIAPYYKTVLITGETGTGKEVIAKALHATSPWAKQPFLVCNCGSLVETLIESELFGHRKGAFTGADRDKVGLFEAAGEGTLFLDEVGELPTSFQPHLLRVLQDGEFRRLGSHELSKARCRVIAATNRNLELEVKEGRFREDLFFRITPLIIRVPPLRERKDDLPLLYKTLLDRFRERTGKKVFGISRPAQAVLIAHDWPGNVRELDNVLEQAAILTTESFIRLEDLPGPLRKPKSESSTPLSLLEIEKGHIEAVLKRLSGNRTRAAAMLEISRRALIRRIRKLGIKA